MGTPPSGKPVTDHPSNVSNCFWAELQTARKFCLTVVKGMPVNESVEINCTPFSASKAIEQCFSVLPIASSLGDPEICTSKKLFFTIGTDQPIMNAQRNFWQGK